MVWETGRITQRTYMHVYIAMDTDNNVVKASGGGRGLGERGRGGEMGEICNSVNNKKGRNCTRWKIFHDILGKIVPLL